MGDLVALAGKPEPFVPFLESVRIRLEAAAVRHADPSAVHLL